MNKLLTISIAAYNMQQYLRRCLDSILEPSIIDDLEILVINDGSQDNTMAIAQEYQNRFPHTVIAVDKENGGHGSTVNLGIQLAKGKYFRLLDADDWFETTDLTKFIERLKETDCDLILTNYAKEFTSKNKTKTFRFRNIQYDKVYDFRKWSGLLNCGAPWFDLPTITYKTNILQSNNIRISECFYSDIEFDALPLLFVKDIMFIDLSIYRYFIGREGQSVSPYGSTKHYPDHLRITYKMIDFYNEKKNSVNDILREIYLRMVLFKITANYVVLLRIYLDRTAALVLLREFDASLRLRDNRLYKLAGRSLKLVCFFRPILVWRGTGINLYQTFIYKFSRRIFKNN